MPGEDFAPTGDASTSVTIEELTETVSGSVVDSLSPRLDALEKKLDGFAGRLQVEGLSERLDALSGAVATREDLSLAKASLAAQVEEAALMAGEEIGPVIDGEVGSVIITLVGQLWEALTDGEDEDLSDVAAIASDIRTEVRDVSAVLVHPAMTTDFADYTVLEGLLLLLILWKFIEFWLSVLKGGFSWLR